MWEILTVGSILIKSFGQQLDSILLFYIQKKVMKIGWYIWMDLF